MDNQNLEKRKKYTSNNNTKTNKRKNDNKPKRNNKNKNNKNTTKTRRRIPIQTNKKMENKIKQGETNKMNKKRNLEQKTQELERTLIPQKVQDGQITDDNKKHIRYISFANDYKCFKYENNKLYMRPRIGSEYELLRNYDRMQELKTKTIQEADNKWKKTR